MEGVRDAALADYENLPDEEKAKIHTDFKQLIANGSSTDYIEFFQEVLPLPQILDQILRNCEGYEEGRLDFNFDKIIKFGREEKEEEVILAMAGLDLLGAEPSENGQPGDSYFDRIMNFDKNKKFGRDSKEPEEKEEEVILAMAGLDLLGEQPSENGQPGNSYFDRIMNFDKNKKFGRDSTGPEEKEEEVILAMAGLDLLGEQPSENGQPGNSYFDRIMNFDKN